jgi:hypothetical protein
LSWQPTQQFGPIDDASFTAVFLLPAVYPQQPNQVSRVIKKAAEEPPIGTFVNGRFHHTLTGTEFSLPAGWAIAYQGQSSGGGEQVGFAFAGDSSTPPVEAFVWMRAETHTADEIPDQLRSAVDYKAGMREGIPGYKMLKKTIETKTVGGQLALSVQAQFDEGSVKMIEYHTSAPSEKTHVYLSARMRASDFAKVQARIDQVLNTFLVP